MFVVFKDLRQSNGLARDSERTRWGHVPFGCGSLDELEGTRGTDDIGIANGRRIYYRACIIEKRIPDQCVREEYGCG